MRAYSAQFFLGMLLGCAPLAVAFGQGDKDSMSTYRWVDEKGVVHYGDRVPPQYATQERSILNRQGVETGHVDAQKSPAQLAVEAQRDDAASKQKQHDYFLLTTYSSVKDIEELRDLRLDQLQAQRGAADQYIHSLDERLVALQKRAMLFKPYADRPDARRMPDELAEDLVRTLNELETQRGTFTAKQQEETALRSEFQLDIDRFSELKTLRAAR